jgi:hypothetical protein
MKLLKAHGPEQLRPDMTQQTVNALKGLLDSTCEVLNKGHQNYLRAGQTFPFTFRAENSPGRKNSHTTLKATYHYLSARGIIPRSFIRRQAISFNSNIQKLTSLDRAYNSLKRNCKILNDNLMVDFIKKFSLVT